MDRRTTWMLGALALAACDAVALTDASVDAEVADAAVAPRADAGGPPSDFDGFVAWQMEYGGIPGAALAVVTPEGIVRIGGYGFADLEAARPVDEHTLFIMASISKTLAAVRAMQLVEAGALDLDAPASSYLGYPLVHPDHPEVPITTRMLLTHVSGLQDDFPALGEVTTEGDPVVSLDEFTRMYAVPEGSLYDAGHWGPEPETDRQYCNAGFGVVGAILEAAGGASFRDQTRGDILEPLGMDDAGWFLADVDAGRLATPYAYNGRTFSPLPQSGFAFYPANSLRVSATGLARFAQMILRQGELDGSRAMSEASVQEMLRIQNPRVSSGQALAFSRRSLAGHDFIGHSGSTFGGSTQLLLAEEGTHALLLITNSDAYLRSRLISRFEGDEAIDAILARMDEEARAP